MQTNLIIKILEKLNEENDLNGIRSLLGVLSALTDPESTARQAMLFADLAQRDLIDPYPAVFIELFKFQDFTIVESLIRKFAQSSNVVTRLELAFAFRHCNNPELARPILEELAKEDNADIKRNAKESLAILETKNARKNS